MENVTNLARIAPIVHGTLILVRCMKALWAVFGIIFVIAAVWTLAGHSKGGHPEYLWNPLALIYFAVAYGFVRCVGEIVNSLSVGTPFTSDNSRRLRRLAWLILLLGILDMSLQTTEMMDGLATIVPATVISYIFAAVALAFINPALMLVSPVLFILARVFDAGIAMRDDVEGTV